MTATRDREMLRPYSEPTPAGWYLTSTHLLRQARASWRLVLSLAATGAAAGGITALLLPSRYQVAAAFQAENPPAQLPLGALSGVLGSQLTGLLGSPGTPQLLATLLTTDGVLRRVVNATFPRRGKAVPLGTIYGFGDLDPGEREFYAIRKLRRALSVDADLRTGIVRFNLESLTPELALAIAETTLVALNDANIELRKQRASAERAFTAKRSADAGLALAAAESTLTHFYQRNRSISSPMLLMEESRLRRSVDMAQQLFIPLRLQEEQAGLQALRNTPAISIIDPPVLPVRRSWPNRRLAVATGLMIGLALAFLRLVAKPVAAWAG